MTLTLQELNLDNLSHSLFHTQINTIYYQNS